MFLCRYSRWERHIDTVLSKTSDSLLSLQDQIRNDLANHLLRFKSKSAGIRQMERNTGIGKRQILRYLSGECTPHFYNLKKLYSYLYNEYDYGALLKKLPLALREIFSKYNPIVENGKKFKEDYGEQLANNPVFFDIYWKTVDDSEITREDVIRKYGDFGLNILRDMRDKNIVKEVRSGVFSSGLNRSAPLSPGHTKKVCQKMIDLYYNAQDTGTEGRNYISFNVVKLDKQSREEIIQEILRLNRKIIELEKNTNLKDDPQMMFNVFCIDRVFDKNYRDYI